MQTDRTLISLSDLVHRASAIVDPEGSDPAVTELLTRFEDADEPVRGQVDQLEERLAWGADEDPPIVMAQAVVLYLAHSVDEVQGEPAAIMRHAALAEFDGGKPPETIVRWLEERGVTL
jgi:hypothetical protein